ncbi:MAG TPA: lipid II flippase MurJ [Candidatus Wunengus sp. YC63]|uniref:lipid II flippase MurJ n=1 Tax=unclassified Candidatus Wunengus TaxID=3367695 RepID=UPI004026E55C
MDVSKILRTESYKRGIIISSGFNFISKVLFFLTNIIIAYYFGTQVKTDIYYYCLCTVSLMVCFITGLNASVVIPESMHLAVLKSKEESMRFINFFMFAYIFIGIAVSIALLVDPVDIFLLISKFETKILLSNVTILFSAAPLFILMMIATYLIDILTSFKYFTIPMISNVINSALVLFFLFFFHKTLDIASILVGLIVAYTLQICLLLYVMLTELNWNFSFKFIHVEKRIIKNIVYAQIGNFTTALSSYVPLYLLSGFSSGIITSLNYGQRIADSPTIFLFAQLSAVVGIKFNELYAEQNFKDLNETFITTAHFLLFILTPISAVMFIFSNEITTVLLKRGAFNEYSVKTTSAFLKYLSLLLPMYAINSLISRLLMAGRKILQGFLYQIIFNAALMLAVFGGIQLFGVIGYPVGLLCLHVGNILACYFFLKQYFPMVEYQSVLIYVGKVLMLNLIISFPLIFIKNIFNNASILASLTSGAVIYFVIIVIMNEFLNLNIDVHNGLLRLKMYCKI